MRKILLALGISLLGSSPALAGPDETTNYFMDNPPSLFDFGVFKANQLLRSSVNARLISVDYNWDDDKIVIFGLIGENFASCPNFIAAVREASGYGKNGKLMFGTYSRVAALFSHEGYIIGDQELNNKRLEDLDKKFRISCYDESKRFEAKLPGTQISITDLN